ncbi:MAG: UDP-4-amino-4,6-dideoxy-N-acetyl-beta-L-altrosamine transaminase [Rhodospirillaceae bacterium]|jgi:UDP-4-amino-4,6-dideoxy-N-acetyl-beta-L-altrosamine transaminase|nr:UDP-4-amino-4,6-dideoxy-N-acetyl-beta-L-altrosamine transaminase [Rhodospirillaceae bacterium]
MTNLPDLPFLPYGRHAIDDDDIEAVTRVLRSDFLTTGPAVAEFEETFARETGAAHAVACANGTAALHLAALALELGPGDHVVVPTITFLASANAARFVGADVIFADVDPETGLMGAEELAAALDTNRDKSIRAVFPVHLAGRPADPEGVSAVARAAGIGIVEDACHALGTRYQTADGQVSVGGCSHADMATFSFHPVKTIASGEGGMVTTNDASLAARLKALRSHGMTRDSGDMQITDRAFDPDGTLNPWYYEMPEIGFNYRLSDIHAALGTSQLGKLETFAARHRALAALYDELLEPLAPVIVPVRNRQGTNPVQHLYQVLIDFPALEMTRATLMNTLRDAGIGTQVHYIPVHTQPYYRAVYGNLDLPGAEAFYQRCLSLPFYPGMTEADAARVVDSLRHAASGGEF